MRQPQDVAVRPNEPRVRPRHISWAVAFLISYCSTKVIGWMPTPRWSFRKRNTLKKRGLPSQDRPMAANNEQHPAKLFERRNPAEDSPFHEMAGPPYLALVTEPDACDTIDRMIDTLQSVQAAVSTNEVALVSVRVVRPSHIPIKEFEERVVDLTRRLMTLTQESSFFVVVTSDWIKAAVKAPSHGVHVKEGQRSLIPGIRQRFSPKFIIGTSAHSISSAVDAWSTYHPDYFFVGTCFATASHPDKVELEGPTLPGQVCRALDEKCPSPHKRPIVIAIGGINAQNCNEPVVKHGADGVATIRAVLQSCDPAHTVKLIRTNMQANY